MGGDRFKAVGLLAVKFCRVSQCRMDLYRAGRAQVRLCLE